MNQVHTSDPYCDCFECQSPDHLLAQRENHADTEIFRAKVPIKLYASPSDSAKVYRTIAANGVIGDFIGAGLFRSEPAGWKNTTYGWIKDDPSTWYQGSINLTTVSPEVKEAVFKNVVTNTAPGGGAVIQASEGISSAISFLTGYWKQILIGVALILIIALFLRVKG